MCAVAALVILLLSGRSDRLISGETPSDLRSLYLASAGFGAGSDIYDHAHLTDLAVRAGVRSHVWPYLYPPPVAFYLSPLASLGMTVMARAWLALSILAGVLVVVLSLGFASSVVRSTTPSRDTLLPFGALLLCLVLPFGNNLRIGQTNLLVLACLVSAVAQRRGRGRDLLAGALLAPAAVVKGTPLALLPFFVLSRSLNVLWGLIAGLAILVAPTLMTAGGVESWGHFLRFSRHLSHGATVPGLFPASATFNFSIAGCIARLTESEATVRWTSWVVLALLGLVLLWRHWRIRGTAAAPLLLGPYLIWMVIASPLTYVHHVVYIYPGLVTTMWSRAAEAGERWRTLCLIMLALAGVASLDLPMLYDRLGASWPALRSLNLYALLGLFVLGLLSARLDAPVRRSER
jgi:alpha-1,2-mannosyltransferase